MIAILATNKKFLKKTTIGSHFTLKMDEISSVGWFWFSASSGPVMGYLDWAGVNQQPPMHQLRMSPLGPFFG